MNGNALTEELTKESINQVAKEIMHVGEMEIGVKLTANVYRLKALLGVSNKK